MAIVQATETTVLRSQPSPSAPISGTLPKGSPALVLDVADGGAWTRVRTPPDEPSTDQGWVESSRLQPAEAPLPVIIEVDWVRRAFSAATEFNLVEAHRQYPAITDFLLALAILVSGMANTSKNGRTGPLQYTDAAWAQLTAGASLTGFLPGHAEIRDPFWQLHAGCLEMHRNGRDIAAAHRARGLGSSAENPFVPDYLALLHAHLLDAGSALALWQARQGGGNGDVSLGDLVLASGTIGADGLAAAAAAYPELFGAGAATTAGDFNSVSEQKLGEAFKLARQLFIRHVPEVFASGSAPWMTEARRLEGLNLSEAKAADQAVIKGLFAATDHGAITAERAPAWCGAFAAHCLKTGGGPAAASIPKGAAWAANWRDWGDQSLGMGQGGQSVPLGAVVVLSPDPGTTDSSGHVGFFVRQSDSHVRLLGGNQSNTVRETDFPLARVVDIRWLKALDQQPASAEVAPGAAAGALAIYDPAEIPAGTKPNADLIIARFAEAGYAAFQQLAALANAFRESSLVADKRNLQFRADGSVKEDSVGLFQCNRAGGLGRGYTFEQLCDPELNIKLILAEARVAKYRETTSLADAVDRFVRKIEKPANKDAEVAIRLQIAERLGG